MIVELRQYTLKPGQRDTLVALFEREFVESQEALGMEIIGTFTDAGNPDRFVWLRGFPDMERRARSLAAFYGGPVWKTHREAANATMIDSDNVLLLKPAWEGSGLHGPLRLAREARSAPPPRGEDHEMVVATICHFAEPVAESWLAAFRAHAPKDAIAALVTEPAVNTFPALPVREGENVFVVFSACADQRQARQLELTPELERQVMRVEVLRLLPTARSRLRA